MHIWPVTSSLPAWQTWSAVRLYGMFLIRQRDGAIPASREDQYARLLMRYVELSFQRHDWIASLPRVGLEAEDVAMKTVEHLRTKSRRMQLRHKGYRVLLSVLNTAIYFFVMTQVKERERKTTRGKEIASTDFCVDQEKFFDRAAAVDHHPSDCPAVEEVNQLLGEEETEDAVIGDLITRTASEADALMELFRLVRDGLRYGWPLPAWEKLPVEVRSEVSLEQHAIVVSRVRRVARRYAVGAS